MCLCGCVSGCMQGQRRQVAQSPTCPSPREIASLKKKIQNSETYKPIGKLRKNVMLISFGKGLDAVNVKPTAGVCDRFMSPSRHLDRPKTWRLRPFGMASSIGMSRV